VRRGPGARAAVRAAGRDGGRAAGRATAGRPTGRAADAIRAVLGGGGALLGQFQPRHPGTARSGWVTDLTPGLRFDYSGARLRANVDFRVHFLRYAGDSELNETQRYLNARASLDPIQNFLRLDANAERTQELRSQFGAAGSRPTAPRPAGTGSRPRSGR
jgi:hypothetical protein